MGLPASRWFSSAFRVRRSGQATALAVALALASTMAACNRSPGDSAGGAAAGNAAAGAAAGQGDKTAAPAPGAALPVTVVEAQPRRVPLSIEAVGRTEGSREVEVRARVSGILQRQLFREGEPVRAGAPMYRIDRAPFEIALEQARATLEQERSRLERSRLETRRLQQLAEERAISQREYDDALAQQRIGTASVALAQAKLREAELNLSYTTVDAPIAGIAGRALRSEGSLVIASTDSGLLTTLVQTDPLWVRFSLSEAEFAVLRAAAGGHGARGDGGGNDRGANRARAGGGRPDDAGRVVLVGTDGKPLGAPGRLNFTASTVDAKLGTVQMRAEFPNPDLALLPGQFVQVRVRAGDAPGFLVPQAAVQQNEQGRFVWVVDDDGKAAPRPVEVGSWVGRDWAIRKGLSEGDRVIVDNLLKLRPGASVAPQAAPAGAPGSTPGGASTVAPGTPAGAPVGAARAAG